MSVFGWIRRFRLGVGGCLRVRLGLGMVGLLHVVIGSWLFGFIGFLIRFTGGEAFGFMRVGLN